MSSNSVGVGLAFLLALLLAGCAVPAGPAGEPVSYRQTPGGTAVWQDEYEFVPPSSGWELMRLEEDDYSFAYVKYGDCPFPCQSTFAYDEEPFGYSRDLEKRQEEFYRRFLWASRLTFEKPVIRPVRVLGEEGLEAAAEGKDLVRGQKVWTKVVFARRGERVVAFYFTQWRPMDKAYDLGDLEDFDRFVASFRFLKKSFYQTL